MNVGSREVFQQAASNDEYVTNGLIAWFDGIWNTGLNQHDSNATAWKDLANNGFDAKLRYATFNDNSLVTSQMTANNQWAAQASHCHSMQTTTTSRLHSILHLHQQTAHGTFLPVVAHIQIAHHDMELSCMHGASTREQVLAPEILAHSIALAQATHFQLETTDMHLTMTSR